MQNASSVRHLAAGLTLSLLVSPPAMAGRWVDADPEYKSVDVLDTSGDGGGGGAPHSVPGASFPSGDDCDDDIDLPNISRRELAVENVVSSTTESTAPNSAEVRRNLPIVRTVAPLPDQMLSFSYSKRVEGRFLNQYALQVWGKFARTITIQPFQVWEVVNWQTREQKIIDRTFQISEWDQLVECPSGRISTQLLDSDLVNEQAVEFTPWSPQVKETLLRTDEDPPAVSVSMTATYSAAVLVSRQRLVGLSGPAAGSLARANKATAGDVSRRGGEAISATSGRIGAGLGSGRVAASASMSNASTYIGAQALAILADSGQNLRISAPGFSEPLVLMGQAVVGNMVGYRVKSIKVTGTSITAISFYGPEGEVIEGKVLP